MRWLSWGFLLLLAAAGIAMLLRANAGNVAFFLPPYRVDVSLNLFVIVLGLLLGLMYWFARGVQKLVDFPDRVRVYRARREEIGSQAALRETVKSLLEGRFARAERAARVAQQSPPLAGVAALLGARASHRMQEYQRRDEWLDIAEADSSLLTARLVSSAEMWSEQRDNVRALEAIDRLQSAGARQIHATRIALNANIQAGRWPEALKALHVLEKRNAMHPVLAARLKCQAYCELLGQRRHDPGSLEAAWNGIPIEDRRVPEVALEGARLLNLAGRGRQATLAVEGALQKSPMDWGAGVETLLDEYARAQVFPSMEQVEKVENWLKQPPRDVVARAALLRCAGQLCLREQLWGKARAYLEESLRELTEPATLLALARLSEAVGDDKQASEQYRQAALGFSRLALEAASPSLSSAMRRNSRDSTI